jgi:transcriptional regulator with XRE-family HTH domain
MPAAMGAGPGSSSSEEMRVQALGAAIRALRGHARLSQEAFGKRTELHPNYLGALERAEIANPGLGLLARVAHGLGVSIAVLADSYAAPPAPGALRVDTTTRPAPSRRPTEDVAALGRAIRLIRRDRDLTQEQLARKTGIHRSYLGSVETGDKRIPGIGTVHRIAEGLGRVGEDAPLPLLARVFTGEVTLAEVRAALGSKPSGSSDACHLPQASADT